MIMSNAYIYIHNILFYRDLWSACILIYLGQGLKYLGFHQWARKKNCCEDSRWVTRNHKYTCTERARVACYKKGHWPSTTCKCIGHCPRTNLSLCTFPYMHKLSPFFLPFFETFETLLYSHHRFQNFFKTLYYMIFFYPLPKPLKQYCILTIMRFSKFF